MASQLIDYYRILHLDPTATAQEVKRAYRRLAKKFHPDLHPGQRDWAQGQFKSISQAYDTLGDLGKREAYDVRHRLFLQTKDRRRRRTLAKEDEVQRACRAILNELLADNSEEAIGLYEALKKNSGTEDPLARLEIRDYLDTKFLLGEAYEAVGDMDTALDFYEEVFREESMEPRVRCYFGAIIDRLRGAYFHKLAKSQDLESADHFYQKAVELESTNGALAEIHKKMAEILMELGKSKGAEQYLKKALRANPKLKGIQRLLDKLEHESEVRQCQ